MVQYRIFTTSKVFVINGSISNFTLSRVDCTGAGRVAGKHSELESAEPILRFNGTLVPLPTSECDSAQARGCARLVWTPMHLDGGFPSPQVTLQSGVQGLLAVGDGPRQ